MGAAAIVAQNLGAGTGGSVQRLALSGVDGHQGLPDYGERATISENLEAACVALNQAFRGIWIEKALEHGHVREYWDEGDIDELETLTLDASSAVERAWRVLSVVVDAHAAQREAEYDTDEDD